MTQQRRVVCPSGFCGDTWPRGHGIEGEKRDRGVSVDLLPCLSYARVPLPASSLGLVLWVGLSSHRRATWIGMGETETLCDASHGGRFWT